MGIQGGARLHRAGGNVNENSVGEVVPPSEIPTEMLIAERCDAAERDGEYAYGEEARAQLSVDLSH